MLNAFLVQRIRKEEERHRERDFLRPSLERSLLRERWPESPEDADRDSAGERGLVILEWDET